MYVRLHICFNVEQHILLYAFASMSRNVHQECGLFDVSCVVNRYIETCLSLSQLNYYKITKNHILHAFYQVNICGIHVYI